MAATETEELYNLPVEYAILSAIVFENELIHEISEKLSPNDFYLPSNRDIYSIILELAEEGKPIDEVFIEERLRARRKDYEMALLSVLSANPIANTEPYLEMLKDLSAKRRLFDLSIEIRKKLDDSNVESSSILFEAMEMIERIQDESSTERGDRKISEITAEIRSDMDKARTGEKLPFFETGYRTFDSQIGGFAENGLNVVAARPSMGKSSFVSGPIVNTIKKGKSAVLYSMEVVDKNALARLISFKSQEPLSNIKKGLVRDISKFNEAMEFFESMEDRLVIVDRSGMNKRELELDIIKRIKRDPSLELIVVDHLLQMQIDPKKHTPTELGEITKMLKRICQNYKVTVVLLSQLNRAVEARENKRPMMADLQGSGSIEQDADLIVFLYRSEYYKEKEWDQEKNGGPYQRKDVEQAEVIVGKNRDGPTGSVELGFRAKTASFLTDYLPDSVTEYVYTEDDENDDYQGSVKENDAIIPEDTDGSSNVSMPLI